MMVSKLALLSNLLLASVAMAVPPSQLGARLARGKDLQSQPSNRDVSESNDSSAGIAPDTTFTFNWAGAQVTRTETFEIVTATFTVPTASGADGGALIWVGIGSPSCSGVLLSGLRIRIKNGQVVYNAVWEWWPARAHYFPVNSIRPGDSITLAVHLMTTTYGVAIIVNHTSRWMMSQGVTSSVPLCNWDAEWIIEDYQVPLGTYIPFVNFGSVAFRNALAYRNGGHCDGSDGPQSCTVLEADLIFDIAQDGLRLTSTIVTEPVGEPLLTISYI